MQSLFSNSPVFISGDAFILNSNFTSCDTTALTFTQEGSSREVLQCNFHQNGVTTSNGGAIASYSDSSLSISNSQLVIARSSFSSNIASSGGAIYAENNLLISDNFFENNNAVVHGGAISFINSISIMKHCTFTNNTAPNPGTSVWMDDNSRLTNSSDSDPNVFFTDNFDNITTTDVYCPACSLCPTQSNSCTDCANEKYCLAFYDISASQDLDVNSTKPSMAVCYQSDGRPLCNNQGVCQAFDNKDHTCRCFNGYRGDTCSSLPVGTLIFMTICVFGIIIGSISCVLFAKRKWDQRAGRDYTMLPTTFDIKVSDGIDKHH